jgi:hypothetical protein
VASLLNTRVMSMILILQTGIVPMKHFIIRLWKLKKDLQEQIANTPDMVVERKQQLEAIISNLDSANNVMMDWMHKFSPLPDSADQEKAREYLETEIERVKKVKELMIESIEKAEAEVKKN